MRDSLAPRDGRKKINPPTLYFMSHNKKFIFSFPPYPNKEKEFSF